MLKESTLDTLKHLFNVTAVVLISIAAGVLFVLGLLFDTLVFINEYRTLLLSLVIGLMFIVMMCGLIFYILDLSTPYKLVLCLDICLLLLGIIFYIVSSTGLISKITDIESLREMIARTGAWAALVFILVQFLQVVVLPIPSTVTVMAGTALFGPLLCSVYSFIGIFAGSIVAFAVGRLLGYRVVSWIVGREELDKWLKKLKGKDYLLLSIMFLLPLFPDDVLCFVAGLSTMTWGYYIIMIMITRMLSITLSAYSFESIPFNTWWGILCWVFIVAAVIALFALVCKYSDQIDGFIKNKLGIGKKHEKRKKQNKDVK